MGFFRKHRTLLADFGLVYCAAIWGSTFFIVKNSLDNIDPVMLVAYRFLFAAFFMALFLDKKKLFANWKKGLVLGFFLGTLYIAQTIGLKYTTASNSGFITGLFIIFVPIFYLVIFKKNPGVFKIVSVLIALLGLFILTGGLKEMNLGDILTLAAAITYALHILFADKYIKGKIDPYILSFQQFLFVGLMALVIGIIFRLPFNISSSTTIYSILFLAIFPGLLAFLIQLLAQKHTAPIKVALIFSLEPVFAAAFAWTLGGESFITQRAIGGFLIVIAMIMSELPLEKWILKKHSAN